MVGVWQILSQTTLGHSASTLTRLALCDVAAAAEVDAETGTCVEHRAGWVEGDEDSGRIMRSET